MPTDNPTDKPPAPYQPNKRTIGELLSMTSPPIVVPDWQRNYSWSRSHVETFWNDLSDFERRCGEKPSGEYFLGSVVIVETSAAQHLLLDGQQRLATSAILLSVIRDFIKNFKADASHRIQARYLADVDDAQNKTVYKLTLNAYDREFFRQKILEERNANFADPESEHASHKLIASARQFFEEVFKEKYDSLTPEEAFQWSLRIQTVLMNHMTVISVTSTDEDSAAEVFETLNDRGIGLSTPDLLRNLVMRRANDDTRPDIVNLWGDIIEFDADSEIKTFLRHYWISHFGDVKTQGLYREIKSHLLKNNVDSLKFSRELADASIAYRDLKAGRHDDEEVELLLCDISEMGAGSNILYPVLLSIIQTLEEGEIRAATETLLNLYVRHSVIAGLENSKLENQIYKVATVLRANKNLDAAIRSMAEAAPDDAAVQSNFGKLSINHNGTRRYLLRKLEEKKRTTEELRINPPSKVHVEHIYPQTPQTGHRIQNHEQYINRIGNLTLLSKRLNLTIKNSPFNEKKPFYKKSELLLTKDVGMADEWGPKQIDDRQSKLAKLAPSVWPIGNPHPARAEAADF